MAIAAEDGRLKVTGVFSIEDTEKFLALLREYPDSPVDLGECDHVHTAALQIVMASGRDVTRMPREPFMIVLLGSFASTPERS